MTERIAAASPAVERSSHGQPSPDVRPDDASAELPTAADPADAGAMSSAARVLRTGTRHRSQRKSILSRVGALWFPLLAGGGLLMLSITTMFTLIAAVRLQDQPADAIISLAPQRYSELQQAVLMPDSDARQAEVRRVLKESFDTTSAWIAAIQLEHAEQRFAAQGVAGFTARGDSDSSASPLEGLSAGSRAAALRALGLYLTLLAIAMFCSSFGMSAKQLGGDSSPLAWLWQFPVSRQILFLSKLVEYISGNGLAAVMPLFHAITLWIAGWSFLPGLGVGALTGISAGFAAAAFRLAAEIAITLLLRNTMRGALLGAMSSIGSLLMLVVILGASSQYVVESFLFAARVAPEGLFWNPFAAGIGSLPMQRGAPGWWLVNPAIAVMLCTASLEYVVYLTRSGLTVCNETSRTSHYAAAPAAERHSRFDATTSKSLLQFRRQPEYLAQVLATPFIIEAMLYFSGNGSVTTLAMKGGMHFSVAVLAAGAYLLIVAAGQTLRSELKYLWLLQCQPRPLANVLRSYARVWAIIAMTVITLLVAVAIVRSPAASGPLLVQVPYLLVVLWLLAESIFGVTALAASINNEQNVRVAQSGLVLPLLIIGNVSVSLYSGSWWAQLASLVSLVILNATVRERQLAELPWLSEPMDSPPRQVYPMDGLIVLMGFQGMVGGVSAGLISGTRFSTQQMLAISYITAAVSAFVICIVWMRWRKLTLPPAAPDQPVAQPLIQGLMMCSVAAITISVVLHYLELNVGQSQVDGQLELRHGPSDRWYMLMMWVLAAPLFEEWAFRGMIFRGLRRNWDLGTSVAATTILFITMHSVTAAPALIVLAVVTALTAERTGRLWPSMVIHGCYNLIIWTMNFVVLPR